MSELKIEWTDGTDGLKRGRGRRPGYDCRTACEHATKGEHGWHTDEWIFLVRGDNEGLSLVCYTDRFDDRPDLTKEWQEGRPRLFLFDLGGVRGAALTLHVPFATNEHHLQEGGQTDCALCTPCFTEGTLLGAGEFWREHGEVARSVDQAEPFWAALEAEYQRWRGQTHPINKRCCPTCNGAGLITVASINT
jgi:hypothetical protein